MLLNEWLDIQIEQRVEVTGICMDSRQVKSGDAFIALNGPHYNAEQFIDKAIERGAVAVLIERQATKLNYEKGVPIIAVPNLSQQVGGLAAKLYHYPSRKMRLIGITGTNGKTSCSVFMAQALSLLGAKAAVIGTLGYGPLDNLQSTGMTTPDPARLQTILSELHQQEVEFVVMEVSSHALDQHRVEGLQFELVLFTNLTQDHLDYHGTMAAYAAAKRRLLNWPGVKAFAINADDGEGQFWLAHASSGAQVCAVGTQLNRQSSDFVEIHKAQFLATGMSLSLQSSWGEAQLTLPLLGAFNASNLALVFAGLCLLAKPIEQVAQSIAEIKPVPGRMQLLHQPAKPVVVVDFAHTPDALQQVLVTLRELCQGRLICVFGCGGDRDRAKRALMAQATKGLADEVIVTNDNPRTESPQQIVADIMPGFDLKQTVTVEFDRALAINKAIALAGETDMVLVAGKGHESEQIIGEKKLPFSDIDVVKQCLARVECNEDSGQSLS